MGEGDEATFGPVHQRSRKARKSNAIQPTPKREQIVAARAALSWEVMVALGEGGRACGLGSGVRATMR